MNGAPRIKTLPMIYKADSVTSVGGCCTAYKAPHLYYIVWDSLIYIGETQQHPVIRWGQHLGPAGSFLTALGRSSSVNPESSSTLRFCAFCLDQIIKDLPPTLWKISSQWVEHRVHVLFSISKLGVRYEIISSTSRTAPRCSPAPGLDQLATSAFDKFSASLVGTT
jgi:hypothetical protein